MGLQDKENLCRVPEGPSRVCKAGSRIIILVIPLRQCSVNSIPTLSAIRLQGRVGIRVGTRANTALQSHADLNGDIAALYGTGLGKR
eukprot:1653057-Rhodomonas_salina.1